MAWNMYHNFLLTQEDGSAQALDTDVLKLALIDAVYSPAAATDTIFSGISANEVTGTNYTAGGDTASGQTVTLAGGVVTFDIADNTWAQHAAGFADARYVVLYASVSGRLICYHDFVTDKGNVAGPFTVEMDALGVFTKT